MAEYTDRDKALTAFCNFCGVCPEGKRDPAQCDDILGHVLRELEPADVKPVVRGRWIDYDDDYGAYICSKCEENAPEDIQWNFCPNCGADMREAGNGE